MSEMIQRNRIARFVGRGLCLGFLFCQSLPAAHAERIWWDGSRDTENAPPGKLLSDNGGYWGESVLTGVEYSYETAPDSPSDWVGDDKKQFGRRLLNGVPAGDWHAPVGLANKPLVMTFDFKRDCTFSEVDLSTRSQKVAVKIEVAAKAEGPFQVVLERSRDDSPEKMFHRLVLPTKAPGRFLRLTVNAIEPKVNNYITFLEEVIVWGDSKTTSETSAAFKPVAPTNVITGLNFPSIPGVDKSSFSDGEFRNWQRSIGAASQKPAVWSQVSTWDNITNRAILPAIKEIGQPVNLTMARNETENAALALTNTSMVDPSTVEVALSAFTRVSGPATKTNPKAAGTISGHLRVAGTVITRQLGVNIGPLFSVDNKLGDTLMQRYLTNAQGIKDFPRLTLSPAGSAVLWLAVDTRGAAAGIYQARLSYKGRSGNPNSIPIRIEVVDVTLPKPFHWMQPWSGTTGMFPFAYGDRARREVDYKQSLGINVWEGLPTAGSDAALARKRGDAMYQVFILPYNYMVNSPQAKDLTAKDEEAIAIHVRGVVKQAEELKLTYDDWYGELWDEPGCNAETLGALARIIKKIDPKVRLYCNPLFWSGNGIESDDIVYPILSPWYRELIDISVPTELFLGNHPKSYTLFDAKRDVNAFYSVSTHASRGEQAAHVERHRRLAWEAAKRGWNGWGFYSYYRPAGDPWTDLDSGQMDYTLVYPGPRGPIPTRGSEAVREGWEDYRLLSLLKARGRKAEVAAILKGYADGESLPKLRLQALRAAAIAQRAQR